MLDGKEALEQIRTAINENIATSGVAASDIADVTTRVLYYNVLGRNDPEMQRLMVPIASALVSFARRKCTLSNDYVHFMRLLLNRPPSTYMQFLNEGEQGYYDDANRNAMSELAVALAQVDSVQHVNGPEAKLDMIPPEIIAAAPVHYSTGRY